MGRHLVGDSEVAPCANGPLEQFKGALENLVLKLAPVAGLKKATRHLHGHIRGRKLKIFFAVSSGRRHFLDLLFKMTTCGFKSPI
jgi:hypothetical protein